MNWIPSQFSLLSSEFVIVVIHLILAVLIIYSLYISDFNKNVHRGPQICIKPVSHSVSNVMQLLFWRIIYKERWTINLTGKDTWSIINNHFYLQNHAISSRLANKLLIICHCVENIKHFSFQSYMAWMWLVYSQGWILL